MGDVIHALPALTDAQQAIPNLQVDWVVEKSFAEIPSWHSAVRRVIPLELRRWRKSPFSSETRQAWRDYKMALQAAQYDAVIDAQGLLKSALFATRLAQGTKYGYDRHSAREGLSSLFYDKTFDIPYQQHAVERIRKLFAASLRYVFPTTTGDYGIARHFAKNQANLTACMPYIVAIHATTRADKHWPGQAWQALLAKVAEQGVAIYLPWGNELERERAERLAAQNSQVKVLPRLSLTELAHYLANAQAVVSVDTGLSHLTAALDTPNVVLYGATDPKLIGAYGKGQVYVQAGSMAEISVERVWQALASLLE